MSRTAPVGAVYQLNDGEIVKVIRPEDMRPVWVRHMGGWVSYIPSDIKLGLAPRRINRAGKKEEPDIVELSPGAKINVGAKGRGDLALVEINPGVEINIARKGEPPIKIIYDYWICVEGYNPSLKDEFGKLAQRYTICSSLLKKMAVKKLKASDYKGKYDEAAHKEVVDRINAEKARLHKKPKAKINLDDLDLKPKKKKPKITL